MFRIVTGIIVMFIGLCFLVGGTLEHESTVIIGAIITIIGIVIVWNTHEDEIEPIKNNDTHEHE